MRWFWRRERGETVETLRGVLNTLVVDAVKAQTESLLLRQSGDLEFLKTLADLKTASAARTLGKKGGQALKRKAEARNQARNQQYCAVCEKDNGAATSAVIRWHMQGHPSRNMPRPLLRERAENEKERDEQSRQTS